MNNEELQELLRRVIDARAKWEAAHDTYGAAERNRLALKVPTAVQNWDEYALYQMRRDMLAKISNGAFSIMDETAKIHKAAQLEIFQKLPDHMWFRCGDKAVGIRPDTWGGPHLELDIVDWEDNLLLNPIRANSYS
jgi:hypothetical protein